MSDWGSKPSEGGKAGHMGGANETPSHGIGGPSFEPQYQQKRSNDATSQAKRENLADQKPAGVIGNMVKKFTSGPGGTNGA